MSTKNSKLGKLIKKARQEKSLSLRTLGQKSGVDYTTISRLEKGEFISPAPQKLLQLAKALDIDLQKIYTLAGYNIPLYKGPLPVASSPTIRRGLETPEKALQATLQEVRKKAQKENIQELWRFALAGELLAGHLGSLKADFAQLLSGEKLHDVNTNRRDMLVSVFYSLQDAYIGVDSHLPKDFLNAYPTLLDHLIQGPNFSLISKAKDQCYGPGATRIIPISTKKLQEDYRKNKTVWQTYLRKHKENGIRLLQVDPEIAKKALMDYVPGLGWTTDIGVWVRTCAVLYEEPSARLDRDLQLLCPGEPYWRDYIEYVKHLVKNSKAVDEKNDKLIFKTVDRLDMEDVLWSLDALYESPPLAQAWSRFVDPKKRLEKKEAKFLNKIIEEQKQKLGKDKLKVFDAAMGVGSESIWFLKNHNKDCELTANEIEWTLAGQAVRFAKENNINLDFTMYDWRHLGTKLDYLHGKFDVVLALGNSLSCLSNPHEMVVVLSNFKKLLAPGGVLILDERNYRKFFDSKRWQKDDFVPPEVVYVGDIKARPQAERMGKLGKEFMYLEYFEPSSTGNGQHLGYFRVYPFGKNQIEQLLKKAGFKNIKPHFDFQESLNKDSWFVTYTAS